MISINNKKMVGNITVAKEMMPYALYQAQRLDAELERLGQTVGYRNIILSDDSSVHLFYKDGIMTTTIVGGSFNPFQPLKRPAGYETGATTEEEDTETGKVFYAVSYIDSTGLHVRKIPLLVAGGETNGTISGGSPTNDHICPKASCGFFKRRSETYTTRSLVAAKPTFGNAALINYDKLLLWTYRINPVTETGYVANFTHDTYSEGECNYALLTSAASYTGEAATISYNYSGGSVINSPDNAVGWTASGSGYASALSSSPAYCAWALDNVSAGSRSEPFTVVIDDGSNTDIGTPLRFRIDLVEDYHSGGSGDSGTIWGFDQSRFRLLYNEATFGYDRTFRKTFSGSSLAGQGVIAGDECSGVVMLDAIVHKNSLVAALFFVSSKIYTGTGTTATDWIETRLYWRWSNGNSGSYLLDSHEDVTEGWGNPIDSSFYFCYSENYFAYIGSFTQEDGSVLLRSGAVSRKTNKLTTWSPGITFISTGLVNIGVT